MGKTRAMTQERRDEAAKESTQEIPQPGLDEEEAPDQPGEVTVDEPTAPALEDEDENLEG